MNTSKIPLGNYIIGSTVSLKTNHLKSKEQYPEILLAGEPCFITPLMVVSEVLVVKTDKVDEETGVFKNSKGNFQYKCIWFSSKSFKLEENWFYEEELLLIEKDNKKDKSFKFGDNIILKTNILELLKLKTYLEINKEEKKNKTSSLLNFCSPVFVFIGYTSLDKKEPLIDVNTGNPKREYCSKLVKAKSFNLKEDKYSEFLIPIEAVEKIETVDEVTLKNFVNAKKDNKVLIESLGENVERIFSVNSIISIANTYKAEIKNIFSDIVETIEIINCQFDFLSDKNVNKIYPEFSQNENNKFKIESIEDFVKAKIINNEFRKNELIELEYINNLSNKNLFKIVYKNKFERITTRYCIPIYVFYIVVKKYSQQEKKEVDIHEYYLQSYCLLRSDYRNFKIERIMSLEVIENEGLNNFAFENWKKHLV